MEQITRENVLEDEYLGNQELMKHDSLPTRFRGTNARTQHRTERIGLDRIDLVHQRRDFPTEKIQWKSGVHHLNRELGVLLFHLHSNPDIYSCRDGFLQSRQLAVQIQSNRLGGQLFSRRHDKLEGTVNDEVVRIRNDLKQIGHDFRVMNE